jgi:hypothetical protein
MPFVAEKREDKRYVLLDFKGGVTISELELSRTALKAILHETNGYKKVLVDMQNISCSLSAIDIHNFVSAHKNELPLGFLIAVIVHPKNWDAAIFAENVAHNRGVFMRVFRDDLHARAWLGVSDQY